MRTTRTWPLTLRAEAGATARLRGLLASANDALGLPMQIVMERCLGALDAPALRALVELDIPDRVLARPSTAAELAVAVECDAAALERLLAYLTSRGCLKRDRRGRY